MIPDKPNINKIIIEGANHGVAENLLKEKKQQKVSLLHGLYTNQTFKRLVDTTHCMLHNQKKIQIYLIDSYWLGISLFRLGKGLYII